MRLLGIDPGTLITGYALLEQVRDRWTVLEYGTIQTKSKELLSQRYLIIFQALQGLIEKYQPKAIAVETQFVGKNAQTAIKLGMARGMVVLAAAQQGIAIYEYPPTRVKQAITGHGHASKNQIQYMVTSLLGLSEMPSSEDAADALAIALCHAQVHAHQSLCGELL